MTNRCTLANMRTWQCTSGGTVFAKSMAAVTKGDMAVLSLDAFKGQFNIASLIDKIAKPVLDQARQNKASAPRSGSERPKGTTHDSLQVTEQLLTQFDRCKPPVVTLIRLVLAQLPHSYNKASSPLSLYALQG